MSCERMLVEPNRYCSIACKVKHNQIWLMQWWSRVMGFFFFFCWDWFIVNLEFVWIGNMQVLYESGNNGCDTFELSQIEAMEMEMEVKEIKNADLISSTGSVHSNENNSFNNLDEYNSPFHLNLKPKMMHKGKGVPCRSPFVFILPSSFILRFLPLSWSLWSLDIKNFIFLISFGCRRYRSLSSSGLIFLSKFLTAVFYIDGYFQ